jgi:type IV pilus assembly protein PilB
MSYTVQYLESEMAARGLEVSVLVNCLVQDAIRLAASDLHIEPWETSIAVRARVNGVLTEVVHLPLDLMDKISMRFKVMANLVTYQAGLPQDGAALGGPELDNVQLRVSIFPTTLSSIAFRLRLVVCRSGRAILSNTVIESKRAFC